MVLSNNLLTTRNSSQLIAKIAAISVATAALTVGVSSGATAQEVTLDGAGASFPKPLYDRYFRQFQEDTGIQVNYEAIGSGGGIRQFTEETVDFGGSDAAMTDEEIEQVDRGVILVPSAGGAVSVSYNLPGVEDGELRIPSEVLPMIFMGEIETWDDERIAEANPDLDLPSLPIRPVVRADGSGTTFIFTNHLSAISDKFDEEVGTGKSPDWTGNPLGGEQNSGVAATIQQTQGAIGYVQTSYAVENDIPQALIENANTGNYVEPTLDEANRALGAVDFPDNFRVFEGNPGEGYPIVGMTWMMVYKEYDDPETADAIKELVEWVYEEGQSINGTLEYTEIPDSVGERVIETVNEEVTAE
ncbi:MAG: phosphate ABC transporter substrate-binding protein PstS [Halothece sp.]